MHGTNLTPEERQRIFASLTEFDLAYALGVVQAVDPELYERAIVAAAERRARRAVKAGDVVSLALDVEADDSTRHDGGEA